MLLMLGIDGPPVTGTCDMDWAVEYERLLGIANPSTTCTCLHHPYDQHYINHQHDISIWFSLLKDFDSYSVMSWGNVVLTFLYRDANFTVLGSQYTLAGNSSNLFVYAYIILIIYMSVI